jgi:hypothetical protein
MLLKSLLTTALLVGSTSAAFARPIVATAEAGVRIDAQWSVTPRVRDHRVHVPAVAGVASRDYDRYGIDHHFHAGQFHDGYGHDHRGYPVDTRDRSTIECRNWDPIVDVGNERCMPFDMRPPAAPYELPGWTTLGARDSSVPGSQFITLEQTLDRLHIRAIQGNPAMTKMQIRYMDGTADVLGLGRSELRRGLVIPVKGKPIAQVIFYTASGSRGVYLVSGS